MNDGGGEAQQAVVSSYRVWLQRLELEAHYFVEPGDPVAPPWNDMKLLRALAESRCCRLDQLIADDPTRKPGTVGQ